MESLKQSFLNKYPKYANLVDYYTKANGLNREADWSDLSKIGLVNFVDYLQDSFAKSSAKTYCAVFKANLGLHSEEVTLPKDYTKILSLRGCISQNTWITDQEIERIIAYEPYGSIERLVRNQFVIEAVTGARNSDVLKFTKQNIVGDRLIYISQKTHIKSEIPLSNVVVRFLDDLEYVDKVVCHSTFNKYVRQICRNVGINQRIKLFRRGSDCEGEKWEFISSHTGRRSFATNLYLRNADLYSISKLMGHADISTTVGYICCGARLTDKVLEYFKQFE